MVSIKFLALHIWHITSEIYLNDKLFYQWLEKNLAKIFQVGSWAFTLPHTLSNGKGLRKVNSVAVDKKNMYRIKTIQPIAKV